MFLNFNYVSEASYSIVHGRQSISKYNYGDGRERPQDDVDVFLCVARIEKVKTDVTISLNVPVKDGVEAEESMEVFKRIVASLEILDFSIFE
jgi:hypothetical protein